ncbi:hypothetical protein [Aeromonas caviae]|uniref:hypothetical protein n=1 Tax=Aeromonas caviae TaxID=648 RepID=UPI00111AD99E|nr:hypothetical protein [Aeromonas caviae]
MTTPFCGQLSGEYHLHTHCIRYSQQLCPKEVPGLKAEPLELKMGKESFRLRFDCHRCEMQVMGSLKRG